MVGCALDTGNGITVFSDPNREYQVLAPYVITTHIKDMKIIPDTAPGHAPYTCSNCDMGDGIVNIPDAIETMARKSKFAKGLHLIAETGANGWAPEYANLSREEQDAVSTAWYDSYVAKLLAFVNSH